MGVCDLDVVVGQERWWTIIRVDGRACVLIKTHIGEDLVIEIVFGQTGGWKMTGGEYLKTTEERQKM